MIIPGSGKGFYWYILTPLQFDDIDLVTFSFYQCLIFKKQKTVGIASIYLTSSFIV